VVKGIVVTAAMEMLGFFDQDQLFAQDTDPQEALHDVADALAGFFWFTTPPNCIQRLMQGTLAKSWNISERLLTSHIGV
jgi:hypothetical protein